MYTPNGRYTGIEPHKAGLWFFIIFGLFPSVFLMFCNEGEYINIALLYLLISIGFGYLVYWIKKMDHEESVMIEYENQMLREENKKKNKKKKKKRKKFRD